MLRSSKTFVKTSKQGNINRVVREHYLRDDISCGVLDCIACKSSLILQGPDILIPDTNIILHHLDILDREEFNDIVILQTVLEEVRARNIGIHTRLRNLVSSMKKRIYVFSNELHKDTFVGDRQEGSSDNDRNDDAIRKAALWYKQHLSNGKNIILLSNDKENKRIAQEKDHLTAIDLVTFCKNSEQLLDMIERQANTSDYNLEEEEYEEYLDISEMEKGIAAGTLHRASLQTNHYNYNEAIVSSSLGTIYISGRLAVNRAIHGDIVAVRIIEKKPLACPQFDMIEADNEEARQPSESSLNGKVVGILKKKDRAYCGSIDKKTIKEQIKAQNVLFIPMDRRIPRIRLFTRQWDILLGQRIMVRINDWEKKSKYPSGHMVRVLGVSGDKSVETEAILLEHDVAYQDFTAQVLACLPSDDYKPEEWEYKNRMDLRHLDICSIDPPGCTDIDDALHARLLENGNYEVGVHIADVTHFVKATTPLDIEASKRATTVYLVDRRIDMLPPLLGTNLCSLKCNVERFAFSCIWEMTKDAQIITTKFTKSTILSKASFTYDQAQAKLDDPSQNDSLAKSLRILNNFARILKQKRIDSGALTLASPEVRFNLDQETQNPVDVELKEMKEANSLVEEFMLLANISVAQELYKSFPETAVLRRHPSPPAENFTLLCKALHKRGFELAVGTSKELAASLDNIIDVNDSFFNRLVRIMATRCMYQAVYFASGEHSFEEFWHYGLACPIYTHFTSPIRRYSDVLVHRLLHASIDIEQLGQATCWTKDQLQDICQNMNYRHRMAQQAQRSSIELFSHLYFKDKKNETLIENAYVIRISATSIVVLIAKYGIEGIIRIAEDETITATQSATADIEGSGVGVGSGGKGLRYDDDQLCLFSNNKPIIEMFQKVVIEMYIEEVEAGTRQKMNYRLIEPSIVMIGEKRRNVS